MDSEISENQFKNIKTQLFKSHDISRKGGIDAPILELVDFINEQKNYATTSSCSGRLIVVDKDGLINKKSGCKWVYVTHDIADEKDFISSLSTGEGCYIVKFEPFILHVQCRTLKDAKTLLNCALSAGYRNSGITIGQHGKIILAARSTLNMEVPVSHNGKLLVDDEYLKYILSVANEKMISNHTQIRRFYDDLKKGFSS